MAKKKPEKRVTKSDFLRKALSRKPDLELDQLNRRWAKAGHPGTISSALYYMIRRELGIRTVWAWVREGDPFPGEPAPVPTTDETYQFKITLMGAPRPIWRRIVVDDCSLDKLHEHIQTAMGWTNSHLHHFRIGEDLYGDPMLMQENFGEMKYRDSTATPLSAILPRGKGKFRFAYEYDFGDGWEHLIEFESRVTPGPGERRPRCVEGQGACPPEDVGGVWGYADFLEAIADPDHEEHESFLEWVGGKFNADAFRPTEATRRMKQGLPDWRSMR